MKLLSSVFLASLYGMSIRLLYGVFDNLMPIMGISFFILVPFFIGYLTIFLIPYKESQNKAGAFFKPWLTCLVILFVTWRLGIEGMVCWAMAFPFFAVLAGCGGVVAYSRKQRRARKHIEWDFDKEDSERPGSLKVSLLFMIPLLAGLIEGDRTTAFKELAVEKKATIRASPAVVWAALLGNEAAGMKKQDAGLLGAFGFPRHLCTAIDRPVVGGSRVSTYEKGLTLTETIEKMEPARVLALKIQTDPSTISKAIMDEHIVIGGKHIKMLWDEYTLNALPDGGTELVLCSHFCINTPFNWYAGLWSDLLMSDILTEELTTIQQVSGSRAARTSSSRPPAHRDAAASRWIGGWCPRARCWYARSSCGIPIGLAEYPAAIPDNPTTRSFFRWRG
jgi:hypothetical protein